MPQKIDNLTIRAFRNLHDLELRNFGRINLFVGANNSGKTTVLEALSLFCRPLDPLEWIGVARRREIKSSREPVLDAVRWLFPQITNSAEDPYYYGKTIVQGDGKFSNRETLAVFQGFMGEQEDIGTGTYDTDELDENEETSESYEPRRGALVQLKSTFATPDDKKQIGTRDFELWEDEPYVSRSGTSQPFLPLATMSPVSHRVELIQLKQLTKATVSGTKFSILDAVRLIDPEIQSLEVLSRDGISPTLWVQHKHTGYCPLSTLGDGDRRVLTTALSLINVQHGVLLIDEIETAIHAEALARFFAWLVQAAVHYDVQLFCTTHSLEAVDALLKALHLDLDELVAFRLPTQRTGEVAARFSGYDLHELRYESGLEVR